MEMSNMLDVIHFFFEEDHRYQTSEEAQSVSSLRSSIYETIYKTNYKYKIDINSGSPKSNFSYDANVTKPYIPPTEFDPDVGLQFGNNVEPPLR